MAQSSSNRTRGFTLIEVMVAITLLVPLVMILSTATLKFQQQSVKSASSAGFSNMCFCVEERIRTNTPASNVTQLNLTLQRNLTGMFTSIDGTVAGDASVVVTPVVSGNWNIVSATFTKDDWQYQVLLSPRAGEILTL